MISVALRSQYLFNILGIILQKKINDISIICLGTISLCSELFRSYIGILTDYSYGVLDEPGPIRKHSIGT